jgi:hypothetical protein
MGGMKWLEGIRQQGRASSVVREMLEIRLGLTRGEEASI